MPSSTACSSTRRHRRRPPRPRVSSSRTRRRRGAGSAPTARRATTSSAARPACPASDTVTPSGQSTYTWTTTSTDPRALQVPGSSNRVAAVWYSATSFTVDVNLGRRPGARPGAVLRRLGQQGPRRAGADQRRRHGHGAGHRDDLVVHSRRVPGLDGLGQPGDHDHQDRPGPMPSSTACSSTARSNFGESLESSERMSGASAEPWVSASASSRLVNHAATFQFATATLPWSTEPPQTSAEAWVSASAS